MQSGAPTFGTPEPALVLYAMAALARRLGVPFRSGGSLCASKVPDAQAAYESAATLQPTVLGGVNFVLHAAGWLEGGLAMGYEKFILDADQCGMMGVFVNGLDMSENGQAMDTLLTNGPGNHFLGTAHTLANFETAFYRSDIADNNSFEQWAEDGALDAPARANKLWKKMLRGVRAARHGRGCLGGARRVHRQAQGVVPGLRHLGSLPAGLPMPGGCPSVPAAPRPCCGAPSVLRRPVRAAAPQPWGESRGSTLGCGPRLSTRGSSLEGRGPFRPIVGGPGDQGVVTPPSSSVQVMSVSAATTPGTIASRRASTSAVERFWTAPVT